MIRIVRLITEEDVIADISIEESGDIVVKNAQDAAKVFLTPQGMGLMPFCPCAKENTSIKLKKEHVMFVVEADDEVYNAYNSKFGSGIVLASSLV